MQKLAKNSDKSPIFSFSSGSFVSRQKEFFTEEFLVPISHYSVAFFLHKLPQFFCQLELCCQPSFLCFFCGFKIRYEWPAINATCLAKVVKLLASMAKLGLVFWVLLYMQKDTRQLCTTLCYMLVITMLFITIALSDCEALKNDLVSRTRRFSVLGIISTCYW